MAWLLVPEFHKSFSLPCPPHSFFSQQNVRWLRSWVPSHWVTKKSGSSSVPFLPCNWATSVISTEVHFAFPFVHASMCYWLALVRHDCENWITGHTFGSQIWSCHSVLLFLLHFGETLWQAVSASCLHVAACLPLALPTVPDLPGAKWAQSVIYTALSNNGINGLSSLCALTLNAQRCWATDDQNAHYWEGLSKQLDCVYFPDYFSSLWRFLSWHHLALEVL